MFNPKIILGYNEPNGVRNRCDRSVENNKEPFIKVAFMTVFLH